MQPQPQPQPQSQPVFKSGLERSFMTSMAYQNRAFISPSITPGSKDQQGEVSLSSANHHSRPEVQTLKGEERHFAFLLLPNYSASDLACAINVLSLANQMAGQLLYRWQIVSQNGFKQVSSDGLEICVHHSIDTVELQPACRLVVCGGGPQIDTDRRLGQWLRRVAGRGLEIGALNTGSYPLAQAGLLDGYRCASHWEYLLAMQESFPRLDLSSQLFVLDRDRFSCSGGSGVVDLMLHLVGRDWSRELAATISETLVCERMREPDEPQRVPLRFHPGYGQPRLMETTALMEANIEEPLSLKDLAAYVGVSTRQLERLFCKYLGCSPSRYYLELRLTRSRQLLWQTRKSVTDVALACGFMSVPHFSKCYREFFGVSPREVRRVHEAKVLSQQLNVI
jgi:transcriptional regulator GlxA family with amidase domain